MANLKKKGGAVRKFLFILTAIAISGCSGTEQPISSAEVGQLKADISFLKALGEAQGALIDGHQKRISELEGAAGRVSDTAYLDPAGGPGYQYIETNVAPIIISFVDSNPIGDGTKARLKVGNLSSATFSGIEFEISYNRRVPQSGDGLARWRGDARTAIAKDARNIPAGAWTIVDVSLPGLKPDELGYMEVKAKLDTLELRKSF